MGCASLKTQTLCVAAELGIADLLAGGSKNIADLARATKCQRASLHRLMRALASLGLCAEEDDGSFELTPIGALLRTDARPSMRSWAIWCGRYQWPLWGNLVDSVRTGESARKLVTGQQGYEHIEGDPRAASIFNGAMVELTQLVAHDVVRAYDFAGVKRLVDVGGGYGELLTVILAAQPAMHGILFDLAHAMEGATARVTQAGIAQRCTLIAGSFFDSVPGGGDLYLLKSVLHNWDDTRSSIILKNCRRAMSPKTKLVLIERMMPARMKGSPDEWAVAPTDLNMLVAVGGRERTEAEFVELLAASGFKAARFVAITFGFSMIEGIAD
jgi:hypothetical protein